MVRHRAVSALRHSAMGALFAAVLATPFPVAAAARGEITCRIEGRSTGAGGLRVRAGPAPEAHVLGRLPSFRREWDSYPGPSFAIVEALRGWLRIRAVNENFGPGFPSGAARRSMQAGCTAREWWPGCGPVQGARRPGRT